MKNRAFIRSIIISHFTEPYDSESIQTKERHTTGLQEKEKRLPTNQLMSVIMNIAGYGNDKWLKGINRFPLEVLPNRRF